MTTQRSWGRTVTGLSPAGVPPLQAAQIPTKVPKLSQDFPQLSIGKELLAIMQFPKSRLV